MMQITSLSGALSGFSAHSIKINHCLLLIGAPGIGKDTIIEPVKHATGPWNFHEVSPQHMLGRFNGFLKSVILRVNEVRDLGELSRYSFYEHMKTIWLHRLMCMRIDEKHLREHQVLNCVGVVATSNHKTDGIYLPADDRRHYVAYSTLTSDEFGEEYGSSCGIGTRRKMAIVMWPHTSPGLISLVLILKRRLLRHRHSGTLWNANRAPDEG